MPLFTGILALILVFCQAARPSEKTDGTISREKLDNAVLILRNAISNLKNNEELSDDPAATSRGIHESTVSKLRKLLDRETGLYLTHIAETASDPELVSFAFEIIKRFDSGGTKDILLEMLKNESGEQRYRAITKLRELQAGDKITEEDCRTHIIPLITDGEKQIRSLAKQIIAAFLVRIPDLSGRIIGRIKTHRGPDADKQEAIDLLTMLGDETALNYLISLAASPSDEIRFAAAKKLGRYEDEHIVGLLTSLLTSDKSEKVRLAAAISLGRIGSKAAIQPLLEAVGTDSEDIRKAGLNSLRKITGKNLGSNPATWNRWAEIEQAKKEGTYAPIEYAKKEKGASAVKRESRTGIDEYAKFLIALVSIGILIFLYKLTVPKESKHRVGFVALETPLEHPDNAENGLLEISAENYITEVDAVRTTDSDRLEALDFKRQQIKELPAPSEKLPGDIPEEDIPFLVELFEKDRDKATGDSVMQALRKAQNNGVVEMIADSVLKGRLDFDGTRQEFAIDFLIRADSKEGMSALAEIANSKRLQRTVKQKAITALSECGNHEALPHIFNILAFVTDGEVRKKLLSRLASILPYGLEDAKNAKPSKGAAAILAGKLRKWYKKNGKKLEWNRKRKQYIFKSPS
ncbi:MAG: HEAT repeat domain-containing protein [Planctomycetota bacterium]|jgi:HEAT repeat protein